jgi:hypothetical protein
LRKEKEVKETARTEELSKRGTGEMNQEDTAKATEEKKKMQSLLKDTMKKKLLEKTSEEKAGQQQEQVKIGKIKKKGKKRKPNNKEKNKEKEAKTNKATTGNKRKTRPQGEQVIPAATDAHGCSHKGLLELKILPSDYLKSYMREGGWLWKVPCKDCAKRKEGGGHNNRDKSDLLGLMPKKEKRDVGYYCSCGPTGHDMADEHPLKAMYTCDLVLCMGCYDSRKV